MVLGSLVTIFWNHIRHVEGLVDAEDLELSQPHLMIIDDLMDSGDIRIETIEVCQNMNTSWSVFISSRINSIKQKAAERAVSIHSTW